MNLIEACQLRSNELTRILAGCVALDPLRILPMLDRLRIEAFTDNQARQFILVMKTKLPELQGASIGRQIDIGMEVARDCNFLSDYCIWITSVEDLYDQANKSIKLLQGLSITLNTLTDLQDWIKNIEDKNNE